MPAIETPSDPVNHPSHYTAYEGIEIIQLTSQMNFCRGNAVKYVARAGLKNPEHEIQDLEKAIFYIQYEIDQLKGKKNADRCDATHWDRVAERSVQCEMQSHDQDREPHSAGNLKWWVGV